MSGQDCPRCRARGQTWPGEPPRCAFPSGLAFDRRNWNCATMNDLRAIAEKVAKWNEDEWIAAVPLRERATFLVLAWYKSRGATPQAFLLDSDSRATLTLEIAEEILREYEARTVADVLQFPPRAPSRGEGG
jgi:hypothetical protein